MSEKSMIEEAIEILFTLFIVLLLGYVFYLVFWELSPVLAIIFLIIIAVVVIGIVYRIIRGD